MFFSRVAAFIDVFCWGCNFLKVTLAPRNRTEGAARTFLDSCKYSIRPPQSPFTHATPTLSNEALASCLCHRQYSTCDHGWLQVILAFKGSATLRFMCPIYQITSTFRAHYLAYAILCQLSVPLLWIAPPTRSNTRLFCRGGDMS